MSTVTLIVLILGALAASCGLLVEFVAIVAMASYRLRRVLPFQSPVSLICFGGCCFVVGVGLLVVGSWLRDLFGQVV